jgi:predicted nucleic acid-binding Zn ribbon protein
MAVQIPNHAHCVVCGRAIEYGEKTCGPEDAAKLDDVNKRRKRSMTLMYVLMGIAMLVLVLSYTSPGMFGG